MLRSESFRFGELTVPVHVRGGSGPRLLFLCGLGSHPASYADGLARLSRHYTVYVPDLSFRSHRRLPESLAAYCDITEAVAARYAPGAPRVGHSYGGLVALLGPSEAVALSPTIPVAMGWPTMLLRAAALQLREYAGLEGRRGPGWAVSILRDYALTAVARPRCLFPAVSEMLALPAGEASPRAARAHVVLARSDALYRRRECEEWLRLVGDESVEVRWLDSGHDWPVTDPALLERIVVEAVPPHGRAPGFPVERSEQPEAAGVPGRSRPDTAAG